MRRSVIGVLVGTVLLTGCSLLPKEAEEPQIQVAAPVVTQREVYEVKSGTIEQRLSLNVSFGSVQQSGLYFRSGGRVRKVYAKVGETVYAGQILAELENTSAVLDVTNAEISLRRAQSTYETSLKKKGFVDEPSADTLLKQQLDVESAQLSLAQKQDNLANTRLVAPFSGKILSMVYAEGDNAVAYAEAMVLAATGDVVVRTTIDDATAAQLRPGQVVDIFPTDGNATPVKGKVATVPLAGTPAAQKVLIMKPDASSTRLEAGRNGRVEIILERRENVLVVPLSAVRSFSGRYFVTVVKGETRQEVAIEPGIQSSTMLEVKSGLALGDRVVSR